MENLKSATWECARHGHQQKPPIGPFRQDGRFSWHHMKRAFYWYFTECDQLWKPNIPVEESTRGLVRVRAHARVCTHGRECVAVHFKQLQMKGFYVKIVMENFYLKTLKRKIKTEIIRKIIRKLYMNAELGPMVISKALMFFLVLLIFIFCHKHVLLEWWENACVLYLRLIFTS